MLGQARKLQEDIIGFFMKNMRLVGDIYQLKINFPLTLTVNTDTEISKCMLVSQNKLWVKSRNYKPLKEVLGNGLLVSEGDFWLSQRRLSQPAFHRQRLAGMTEAMNSVITESIADLGDNDAAPIDIHSWAMKVTMEIVMRALFSKPDSTDNRQISKAMKAGNTYMNWRVQHPFPFARFFPNEVVRNYRAHKDSVDQVIIGLIEDRRSGNTHGEDLLQMLLDARDEDTGEGMNNQQLKDELLTLFVAGHETTAVAISWCCLLLAQNEQVQNNMYDEVREQLRGATVSFKHFASLEYSRKVIDEAMRLYPPAWILSRTPTEDVVCNGYEIPKGSVVENFIYGIHRHPDHWRDPEIFDPNRFDKSKIAERAKYAYMPFGGGPRLCIGNNFALLEMLCTLACIVQRYRIEMVKDQQIEMQPLVTLVPKNGILLRFHERK